MNLVYFCKKCHKKIMTPETIVKNSKNISGNIKLSCVCGGFAMLKGEGKNGAVTTDKQ